MKKNNGVDIRFASNNVAIGIPKPAKTYVPDWYKSTPLFIDGNSLTTTTHPKAKSLKRCVPFLDSLTTGYVAELMCDVLVKLDINNNPIISWAGDRQPLEVRELSGTPTLPTPAGHNITRLAWKVPYYIQTPKGYSALITHPLNRFDLPFTTLSGVVDLDVVMYAGNLPFFIQQGFEGLIPQGTPIYQIIPFRREDYNSVEDLSLIEEGEKNLIRSLSVFMGWYKKIAWRKKTYN